MTPKQEQMALECGGNAIRYEAQIEPQESRSAGLRSIADDLSAIARLHEARLRVVEAAKAWAKTSTGSSQELFVAVDALLALEKEGP